ncbi:sulfite exporter TauE/SafE family protein [Undibacterium sp. WLHG33]|uniref:sulfite exporter TauE/SafE family protein n=1 Tax=Undibacterium sp. WLHG33 TaxID=3412482 RepID=UPI003C2DD267
MDLSFVTVILGSIVGLVLALTGAGGGMLSIPLLVYGLHLSVQQAAPVGLMAVGFAAALGSISGLRKGIVRYRAAILMGIAGMLAAPIGVFSAQHIPNQPLLLLFACILLLISFRSFRSKKISRNEEDVACSLNAENHRLHWTMRCARAIAGTGFVSGYLSGLVGVGGGFIIIPSLVRHSHLDIRSIQATSLAVITLVSISGVSSAALHGSLLWSVALPFTIGSTLGLLGGMQISRRLNQATIQLLFAWLVLLVAVSMLFKGSGLMS